MKTASAPLPTLIVFETDDGRCRDRPLPAKLSHTLRYRQVEQLLDPVELIRSKRAEILRIAAKHGATNIRVFGSVARGETRAESDVDFLIDAGPVTSSWFPAGLIVDLQDLLGRPVEVVTENG